MANIPLSDVKMFLPVTPWRGQPQHSPQQPGVLVTITIAVMTHHDQTTWKGKGLFHPEFHEAEAMEE